MEEKKLDKLMSEEEFSEKVHEVAKHNKQQLLDNFKEGILYLRSYMGVGLFKSIRRAIRRGHISIFGDIYPKRPFNNRKRGIGTDTYNKRRIYESLTHKASKVC